MGHQWLPGLPVSRTLVPPSLPAPGRRPACCGGPGAPPPVWEWVPLASALRPGAAGGFLELRGVRAGPGARAARGAGGPAGVPGVGLWEEPQEDDAARGPLERAGGGPPAAGSLTLRIAYSSTFRGPELQFDGRREDGSAMPPEEVLDGLGDAEELRGLVRAGEHPATGAPCLTLHGCQSPQVMLELMGVRAGGKEASAERYLLGWFSLVSQPLALGLPLEAFVGAVGPGEDALGGPCPCGG